MLRFQSALIDAALPLLIAGVLLGASVGCTRAPAKTTVSQSAHHLDFNQDVQPILASNCFSCHGPDPEMRKAGLRLDLGETAFKKRPGHPDAIVPGHPEKSELIKRIESKDPHYLMPQSPQGEAKPMKAADIAVLREWIKEGAVYRPHWAFEKPVKAALPVATQDQGWAKTPIDRFVLARMEKAGLHPSPEADKETLIRRVTLDLTGLLPTPGEVKAFVNDTSPQAYEHVVDGLLARPSFGEQRARYWLDYARYADTYGLHRDNSRDIWPYRDYVIRSFNDNKPFDQFVKEQIAGDLLPARNIDQIVASGYVRLGVSTNEAGTIPEELRFNIARERAEAYGATFLGLTVGCAVCHDHKYDPTTQKDFYSLSAFFNNINEQPFNVSRPDWAPVVRIPTQQNLQAYNRVLAKRADLLSQLNALHLQERSLIQRWLASKQDPAQPVSADKLLLRLRLDEGSGDRLRNTAPNANPKSFSTENSAPSWGETTWLWPDFRMTTSTHVMLGQTGDFEWNQPFSCGGWFMMRSEPIGADMKKSTADSGPSGPLITKMDTTHQNRGWDLAYDNGFVDVELIDSPARKLIVSTLAPLLPRKGVWFHILFAYDGSGKASGVRVFINGAPVGTKIKSNTLAGATIRTAAPMQLGWKYPATQPLRETRYQDLRLYARALNMDEAKRVPYEDYVAEIVRKPINQWDLDQWHVVSAFYFNNVNESSIAIRAQVDQLDHELDKLSQGGVESLVSQEKPSIAYADILVRGIYTARKERVEANTPHFLPPLPAGEPRNRLALAKWTVSPENPLTARVTVNRMWNELFGAGIVETTEDFGIMGERPTDPALLDWLAVEFEQSGWNVKHMYKLMVMSAAYRQSAKTTPQDQSKDPKDLLLARGPRFRMDAEMLRDIALQSSGLLVNKIGGPSVKPYQPDNVWEPISLPASDTAKYKQDHGDALYRRSLYTFWKRMAILPNMDAFDAPARDTVCTRRQRTDTPLQALVTMDDVQWVEASRALAERVIEQGGRQPQQRIKYLSDLLLSHDPPAQMEAVLQQSLEQMEQHYAADPKAARELIATGEKPRDSAIPAPELAAWTMVANEMLNLDQTLNK